MSPFPAPTQYSEDVMMDSAAIEKLIEEGIPDATVRVSSDDNTHFQAVVVSDAFAGLRAMARHQLVYRCLGELMGNEIHALSIRAQTPSEQQEQG